jgi:very-short-patch-repair endonuclease
MAATKNKEQRKADFIDRLAKLYPDYTLESDYINSDTFVFLKHKTGAIWKVKPRYLNGRRQCTEVYRADRQVRNCTTTKLTHEEFEKRFYEKFSSNEYQVIGKYANTQTNIEILHKTCGRVFASTPSNLLYGNSKYGCTYCYGKKARTIESTNQELIDKKLSDYSVNKIWQKGGHSFAHFIHHSIACNYFEFDMRISDFMSVHSQRCPMCSLLATESRAVINIKNYLIENNIDFIQEYRFKDCCDQFILPFDFYIEKYNLIIEYDGAQHYKPGWGGEKSLQITQRHDKIKNEYCKNNNINMYRIKYTENEILSLKKILSQFIK